MKRKNLLPFALSAVVAALAGCGGESVNIKPTPNEEASTNGTCTAGLGNCVEWGLEYPLDGLNFNCSSDKENKFITVFKVQDSVATGTCLKSDDIEFYLQSFSDTKIYLGSLKLNEFAMLSTQTQLPRINVLDIARGITGREAVNLEASDPTVAVAMTLVKLLQALALKNGNIVSSTDIQPLYIQNSTRTDLGRINGDLRLTDSDFAERIKPVVDITQISDADALSTVKKLVTIANAAVYQPEFSLFSTAGVTGTSISGSDGLAGCNKQECLISDRSIKHLFGHFMLITDRQGYTFGTGTQWRDSQLKLATSPATTLGGVNAELIRKVKPVQMTADPQTTWLHPTSKRISSPFKLNVQNATNPLEIYQGRLLSDFVMAGKETFYKLITLKTELSATDRQNFGLWRLNADSENYNGSIDLYKIYPISYLDRRIFTTRENIATGQNYVFPIYGNLEFSFNDTTISPVSVGVIIDSNGDVRTNMQSANNLSMNQSLGCQGDVLPSHLQDANAVQQYRLGTIGRTFVNSKEISMRLMFANPVFDKLNGVLVGVDSRIQTSSNSNDTIIVGGALMNLSNVLDTASGQQGRVTFLNSAGNPIQWANIYASFQQVYNATNTDETPEDIALAKLSSGSVSFKLADCYTVKTK